MALFKRIFLIINSKLSYLTIAFIAAYTIVAIIVSLNRFWQYQTFYFDLGIFDSAIWKVSRFQLPLVDHVDFGNSKILSLGDHFNPSLFLLSPFYWLTEKTEMLLVVQALAVGLSGLVAYFIASKSLKNKVAICALVVAFLGYVGMQNALVSDFHEATVAVLPLTFIFWAIVSKKWWLYWILLLVLLGFKETFAGLGFGIGLYLIIRDRQNLKRGIITMLISAIWGLVAIKVLIPYFSQGIYLYTPKTLPESLGGVVEKFIYPPLAWKTVFYTYLTFGFLPLFDPAVLPAIFENFFERFVLSDGKGNDLGMHYNATLSPLLLMGAIFVFTLMEKRKFLRRIITPYALLIIFTVFFLHRVVLRGPLQLIFNSAFYEQNQRVKYVDNFVRHFPKAGLVMTQNDLAVRLTHQDVVLLRREYQLINPDYVILNLTPGQNPNSFFPLSYSQARQLKDELMQDSGYDLTKYADELYLFSKASRKK